jgi:hypothetical protein
MGFSTVKVVILAPLFIFYNLNQDQLQLIIVFFTLGLIVFINWFSFYFLAETPLNVFDYLANLGWWFLSILILLFVAWCFDD